MASDISDADMIALGNSQNYISLYVCNPCAEHRNPIIEVGENGYRARWMIETGEVYYARSFLCTKSSGETLCNGSPVGYFGFWDGGVPLGQAMAMPEPGLGVGLFSACAFLALVYFIMKRLQ